MKIERFIITCSKCGKADTVPLEPLLGELPEPLGRKILQDSMMCYLCSDCELRTEQTQKLLIKILANPQLRPSVESSRGDQPYIA